MFKQLLKITFLKLNFISLRTISRMQKHLVRVIPDEEIINYVKSFKRKRIEVLEISGSRWKMLFNSDNYHSLSFPEINIEKPLNDLKQYDLVILEHVLEHISNPKLALQNIYNILKPNGRIIIVTPFLIKIHNSPLDCTRWTKEGLKTLLFQIGFKDNNIIVGQWGNRKAVVENFKKWVKFNPLKHSLKNEKEFPLAVWAFAQKS